MNGETLCIEDGEVKKLPNDGCESRAWRIIDITLSCSYIEAVAGVSGRQKRHGRSA